MNVEDTCRTEGLLAGLGIGREVINLAGRQVAGIIDRQLLEFIGEDAGFQHLEEVRIEIFKGTASSTDTIDIDGVDVPLDLRGVVPQNLDPVMIDGDNVNRTVSKVDNSGTAWIITLMKAN